MDYIAVLFDLSTEQVIAYEQALHMAFVTRKFALCGAAKNSKIPLKSRFMCRFIPNGGGLLQRSI